MEEDRTPFAHVLHVDQIEKLTRRATLDRGRVYFVDGRVGNLIRKGSQLVARVRGTALYAVSIWVDQDGIGTPARAPRGQRVTS